jgi:hypothetical protein
MSNVVCSAICINSKSYTETIKIHVGYTQNTCLLYVEYMYLGVARDL